MKVPFKRKESTIKKKKKKLNEKEVKTLKIAFNILALFCIIIFSMSLVQKTFQNDTFYTIKIGQLIRTNGIDYIDHFSWHNLPYLYPHWLYDVITSLVYDFAGGFAGVYGLTVILSAILGITTYLANKKISKNEVVSFVLTMGQMYLMGDYIAARAQLVTFILFELTIIFIEKFLEKPKKRYAIGLIIIPILIANIHSAVFPFYFILYLPYLGEYIISVLVDAHLPHKIYKIYLNRAIKKTNKKLKNLTEKDQVEKYQTKIANLNKQIEKSNTNFEKFIIKQNDRRKNPYRLRIEKNDNVLKLFIIMVICIFTGLLTPLKDMPYTYTWRIMQGNTTQSISEHLPLTLIDDKPLLICLTLVITLLMFTKVKIRLRDLFLIGGLTLLAFMSRRQVSMLVLFGGLVLGRILSELIKVYDKKGTEEFMKYITTIPGEVLTIIIVLAISYCIYKPNFKAVYVSSKSYPTQAAKWIKENLDYKDIRLYNDYNYGSYLLFEDIPVFIDSRCDLYTPEFNGEYDKDKKKYVGQDIFSDFINISTISTYYDTKFSEYDITHVMTKTNSKLHMLISRDKKYKEIYKDDCFTIYEINRAE